MGRDGIGIFNLMLLFENVISWLSSGVGRSPLQEETVKRHVSPEPPEWGSLEEALMGSPDLDLQRERDVCVQPWLLPEL